MKFFRTRATAPTVTALAAAALLGGCSTINDWMQGDRVDYRSNTVKARPLEVPPDLSQLSRDARYAPQGGVVSASGSAQAAAAAVQPGTPLAQSIAPSQVGKVRVERAGAQRWLVVEAAPEAVYADAKAFWEERGFRLTTDNAQAGVLETDWVENRAKLPRDLIRSALGGMIDRLYDSGERDRFRTRIERRADGGSEVYLSHRGLEEVYSGERKEYTVWVPRDNDAQLEAEMLTRLMVRLGQREEVAKAAVAAAPEQPTRARITAAPATLEIDEPFDRAWRRVGLALDRGGFTVEDRDRSAGLYFVRYIDPKTAAQEEPGFFARLFGAGKASDRTPQRYRVVVKPAGDTKTTVAVQTSAGAAETGDIGKAIASKLVTDLR